MLPYLERDFPASIYCTLLNFDEWRRTHVRLITPACNRLCKRDVGYITKRMCERKPRLRCRGHISHTYEKENAKPSCSFPTPHREWAGRDTHTRAGKTPRRAAPRRNPFSSREPWSRKSVLIRLSHISVYLFVPIRIRALQKTMSRPVASEYVPLTVGTMVDKMTSRRYCRG